MRDGTLDELVKPDTDIIESVTARAEAAAAVRVAVRSN